jgi:cyanophycin synthetase
MKFNPLDAATTVRILRRYHQLRGLGRVVFGLDKRAAQAEALRTIKTSGLKAAKAGQLGYVQDGTSFQREFYREMWRAAADEIGARFTPLDDTIWDVSYEGRRTRLNFHQTELDNPVTLNVAGNKALCHTLLAGGGLPVPDYLVFSPRQISEAHQFVQKHQGYFVVKPCVGTSAARGITTFVKSTNDCTRAAAIASAYSERILIERVVPGELYRVLVLRGKVIHAIRRPGVRIHGDGTSTIAQLASRALRELSPSRSDPDREPDRDLLANLHAQDLTMRSIPPAGSEVIVKSHRSGMSGGVEETPTYAEDVTELIGPDVKAAAIEAARLIRSEFAGVELITPDTRNPLQIGPGRIIEINTTPGLGPHFDLSGGSGGANPAVVVLRCLLGLE